MPPASCSPLCLPPGGWGNTQARLFDCKDPGTSIHPTRSVPFLSALHRPLQFVDKPTCSPTAASRSSATALLFGIWFDCWVVKACPSDGPGNEHLTPFLSGSRKERLLPSSPKARHKQTASLPRHVTKSIVSRKLQSAKWSSWALQSWDAREVYIVCCGQAELEQHLARHCTGLNRGAVLDLKCYLKRDNKDSKRNKEAEETKKEFANITEVAWSVWKEMEFKILIRKELMKRYEKDKSRKKQGGQMKWDWEEGKGEREGNSGRSCYTFFCSPAGKIQGKGHETSHAVTLQRVTASSFISCTGKWKLTLSFPMSQGCHVC